MSCAPVLDRATPPAERSAAPDGPGAILAGVFVLDSARRANFLATEVPGIVMPGEIPERLAAAADERAEGLRLAAELVDALLSIDGVRGIHLMGIDATAGIREVIETSGLAGCVAAGNDATR